MNPSIGDSERTVLLDEMVDVLSNGRGLLTSHLGVDFPQILRAFSREMPHERCSSKHTSTTGPRSSTASEPHLCSETNSFPPDPLTTHYFFYLGFRALALHHQRDSHSHSRGCNKRVKNPSKGGARDHHAEFATNFTLVIPFENLTKVKSSQYYLMHYINL